MGVLQPSHSEVLPLWPDDFARAYREKGYWTGECLSQPLRDFAQIQPESTALIDASGQSVSYLGLDCAADEMGRSLLQWGLQPGQRMIVQLPNTIELITLFFGCIRAGIVPVMVLPTHRAREVLHLAEGAGAVAYAIPDRIASFDFRPLAQEVKAALPEVAKVLVVGDVGSLSEATSYQQLRDMARPETRAPTVEGDTTDGTQTQLPKVVPSAVAVYLHSGGTSGLPKLIPRTHDDYLYNARASAQVCGMGSDTVYLAALAVEHNFPLACPGILGTLCVGGVVVLATNPSPDMIFGLIERYRVTVTAAVPTLISLWLEAREFDDRDLSSLTLVQVGGAKLAPSMAARISEMLDARVQQVFGMAEGLLNFTRFEDAQDLVETCQGRPLSPDDEIRIVDELGSEVPEGDVGELWVRGPYTIRGYVASDEVNARAFTSDGFYRSGDLVRRLSSGHLVVEGRAGDQINRAAEKFSAAEIEDHLIDHPDLRDVAVIGLPDDALGQLCCAVICVSGPTAPSLRDLRTFLSARGAATYKLPDRLEIVPNLPLTRFGKIDRKALMSQFSDLMPAQ